MKGYTKLKADGSNLPKAAIKCVFVLRNKKKIGGVWLPNTPTRAKTQDGCLGIFKGIDVMGKGTRQRIAAFNPEACPVVPAVTYYKQIVDVA